MTNDSIQSIIKGHYEAGKRSVSQLRKAVQADIPEGVVSATRLRKLCEGFLLVQSKAFGGTVDRIGKERMTFNRDGGEGRALLGVTFGKAVTVQDSVKAAIAAVRKAWAEGADEPRFARQQVIMAVTTGEPGLLDEATRKEADQFVKDCISRNEEIATKAEAARQAELQRRDDAAHAANAKAVERNGAKVGAAKLDGGTLTGGKRKGGRARKAAVAAAPAGELAGAGAS